MTPRVAVGRQARFDTAAGFLASRTDSQLAALLRDAPAGTVGVGGGSATLAVDGMPVFAKRIPLTDREVDRPHCTANLFELPIHCHYGVGGPGFGAWRELAANRIVTEGVLAGETASFPLLYHWRVLPGRPPVAAEHEDPDAVVAALGGSPAVRLRLEALAAASWSLVLFLEHIPYPLLDWLRQDPVGRAEATERQLSEIVAFLSDRELLHLDGHLGNMLTDGERIYLADFGLATSPRFDLSDAERSFVERNAAHDAGYAAMTLTNWLVTAVCGVPVPARGGPVARNEYVRRCATGRVPEEVPPTIARILARQAPAAATMNDFYWRLFGGEVTTLFPGL
ncbi:serine/threonine protein phosphatase [Actinoplanes sp. ATCC 53533]|uniref:serine/threonine protein phosphatase n=1 Tax=Actinoplanes sp. ATCC 53533 TaxID=1288362 RepID=UPI000F791C80|nr:serine/threonine protein phosphatase [Actinoplanes sp. ATCC 53533]RSM41752.1 serine/threonine protein phosphatase [Actinoplanes sp. ATCC 53533]